jgi:predicted Zn-dependent protease
VSRTSLAIQFFAILCVPVSVSAGVSLKPSQGEQIRLGVRVAAEIRRQERLLPDSDPRVKTLRVVGMRLLACFHDKAPWQWSFDVIDERDINAFSLPGGPTFVYTGLLDKLKTEDELAAVLGHEMTHVRREHWAKAYADQTVRSLTLGLLLGVAHAGYDAYNASDFMNGLYTLKFSRGDETQADEGGFDLMTKAGYNPKGMADVFQMLADAQRGGSDPEFFSDHPSDRHRVDRIDARIKAANTVFPPEIPLALDGYDRYFTEYYDPDSKPTDSGNGQ